MWLIVCDTLMALYCHVPVARFKLLIWWNYFLLADFFSLICYSLTNGAIRTELTREREIERKDILRGNGTNCTVFLNYNYLFIILFYFIFDYYFLAFFFQSFFGDSAFCVSAFWESAFWDTTFCETAFCVSAFWDSAFCVSALRSPHSALRTSRFYDSPYHLDVSKCAAKKKIITGTATYLTGVNFGNFWTLERKTISRNEYLLCNRTIYKTAFCKTLNCFEKMRDSIQKSQLFI